MRKTGLLPVETATLRDGATDREGDKMQSGKPQVSRGRERERRTEMRREQRGIRLCDTDREKEIDR